MTVVLDARAIRPLDHARVDASHQRLAADEGEMSLRHCTTILGGGSDRIALIGAVDDLLAQARIERLA